MHRGILSLCLLLPCACDSSPTATDTAISPPAPVPATADAAASPPTVAAPDAADSRPAPAPADTVGASPAATVTDALPVQLHGVWMTDDAEGRGQCQRYRAVPTPPADPDQLPYAMLGSLVVTPGLLHEYAEYGEGNFYQVRSVHLQGPGVWRVEAAFGADTLPSDDDPAAQVDGYQLELDQGRLRFTGWAPAGDPGARGSAYVRCGDLRADVRYDD